MANTDGKGIFPYRTHVEVLDNGLTIIMIPMSSGGLMTYYSIVRTGSRDEYEAGKTGFAHFFEHMMFRGTKNYPANVYDRMVIEMGANANAYTTDDLTAYHLSFASEDIETVVALESDRFQHLSYEEGPFQTEAGAVYGEYRKNRTNPWEVMTEALRRTAFKTHTYGHTTIGFEADIKVMPTLYEYSKEFFSRYYRPENVVLLLVGDFDTENAMTLIRKYYGGWERGYRPPDVQQEAPQTKERRFNDIYDGRTLPLLVVAYKGRRLDPGDRTMVAGLMLGDLLFGETSDIYRKLVLNEQKVQFISAGFGLNRDPGLWSIYSMVKESKDIQYVIDEIDRTVEHFATTLVSQTDLDKLKRRLKYSFLMNLDTPNKVAGRLARPIAITGGIDVVNELYAMYDSITPEDIQLATQTWLTPQRRTIGTVTGRQQP